jgi:cold shock CspA family protein
MTTRVFISYAKEDKGIAEKLYSDLQKAGVEPWLDSVDLVPGQPWETAIGKAISDSSYFIAVLSSRSVGKKGYVQKETRRALEIAEEYPEDRIFIIPLRIDECEPSFERLRRLHRADLFPSYEEGLKDLLRVFNYKSEEKHALVNVDIGKKVGRIWRLREEGFGFIDYFIEKTIFFHHSELRGVLFAELRFGDDVRFSIAEGPKGQVAVGIERA